MKVTRLSAAALALCFVLAVACPALADPRHEIAAAYDRMAAAARKDVDGWLRWKTPDFVSISADGRQTRLADERAAMRMVLLFAKRVRARVFIVSFTLKGKTEAVATIHDHTEMSFPGIGRKERLMVTDTDARATWVKTPEGWREKRSRSLRERGTLDGKPLPGST